MTDLASSPTFGGWTVHLVDLDADAADTMARPADGSRPSAEPISRSFRIRRDEGAARRRFVTTTIAVGAAAGWRPTSRSQPGTASRRQLRQRRPGGVLRALRHVPELVAIATDVATSRPSPDGELLNPLTANVLGIHTRERSRAVSRNDAHLVEACVRHRAAARRGARGVRRAEPPVLAARLQTRGRGSLSAPAADGVRASRREGRARREEGVHLAVSADLLRTFDAIRHGDRHVAEFFGWYSAARPGPPGLALGLQGGRDATMEYIGQKGDPGSSSTRRQTDGSTAAQDNQEVERLVAIASAVITGEDHLELAVNVRTTARSRTCRPAVVEVPAVVGAAGVTGLGVGPLPDGSPRPTARALQQEITVRAALDGDRELAIQALALDPLVPGPTVAEAILDDAVKAHGSVLDRFAAPRVTS